MEQEQKQTLAQRRAKHAWSAIERAKKELSGKDEKSDYKRAVKRLPVGIMTSGLGHTLAFMHANDTKNKIRERVTNDLATWLLQERKMGVEKSNPKGKDIEDAIRNGSSDYLRRITEESLLYLQWLTRFSDAEFKLDEVKDGKSASKQ